MVLRESEKEEKKGNENFTSRRKMKGFLASQIRSL